MSIDASAVVAAWGNYYINEGQNEKRLLSMIREKSVTPSYGKPIITENDVYRTAQSRLGEVVQGFQKAYTSKGTVTFTPNEIRLRNIKIDLEFYPDDVKESWLGFLQSLSEQERAKWPIVRYIIEHEVIPQAKEDMELKSYFKGVYVAPTPGTATAAGAVMDGLKSIITTGLAGNMNTVSLTDAVSQSNAFERVEEFADQIDSLLDGVKVNMYMDPAILRWYLRDKRNTHGADVNYDAGKITVDFTNIKLVGLPSMKGEKMIWATPVDNYLYLRKTKGMKKPKVEESKRQVSLLLDWHEGIGFAYDELVYAATWV